MAHYFDFAIICNQSVEVIGTYAFVTYLHKRRLIFLAKFEFRVGFSSLITRICFESRVHENRNTLRGDNINHTRYFMHFTF